MSEPRDRHSSDPATMSSGFGSITVILSDRGSDQKSAFARRTLKLTPNNNKIHIGRSSKTVSKGLVPASDNAYFDSPVVSREHAVLESDIDSGIVHLIDAGSLHGTTVNNVRLKSHEPLVLTSGDRINFGAYVARGLQVFTPTVCEVDIVPHPHEPAPVVERARSYCAPESVYDSSDSDSDSSVESETHTDTDKPSSNSGDGSSLLECESPTLSAANKIVAELADDSDGAVMAFYEYPYACESEDDDISYDSEDMSSSEDEDDDDEDELDEQKDDEEEEDSEDGENSDEADNEDNSQSNVPVWEKSLAEAMSEDAEAEFLDKELRHFMEKANLEGELLDLKLRTNILKNQLASQEFQAFREAPSAAPAVHEECGCLPVEPTLTATSIISGLEEARDVVMEEAAASVALDGGLGAPSDVAAIVVPAAENKKIDIPSILNPTPSLDFLVAAEAKPEAAKTAGTSGNASSSQQPPIMPVPAKTMDSLFYAASEASVWQTTAPVQAAPVSEGMAAPIVSATLPPMSEEAVPKAVTPKTATKRKIGTALAEDATLARSVSLQTAPESKAVAEAVTEAVTEAATEAMPAPPVEDGPAPKRQATSCAVASKSQLKSKVWAAVETIGIAALGGAVVLGSLIYTAPTF